MRKDRKPQGTGRKSKFKYVFNELLLHACARFPAQFPAWVLIEGWLLDNPNSELLPSDFTCNR